MKAYFASLTPKGWFLLTIPLVAIAYPIAAVVVPIVIKALVPEVVRSVLHMM